MEIKKIEKLPQVGDIVDKEELNGVATYYRSIDAVVHCSKWDVPPEEPAENLYAIHYTAAEFFINGWEESTGIEYVEVEERRFLYSI